MLKQVFFDDYGNRAEIDYTYRPAYKGGEPCNHYRLTCGTVRDNYIYFVSAYGTEREALEKMKEFSCGTFRRP